MEFNEEPPLLLYRREDPNPLAYKARKLVSIVTSILPEVEPESFGFEPTQTEGYSHRQRTRRSVNDIFNEQGPIYVRRAYRMHSSSFWNLNKKLKGGNGMPNMPGEGSTKTHQNGARNGLISTSVRLSAAIRYFAGGRTDDIALVHGISHTEVYNSVWRVVDAVNGCEELSIKNPAGSDEQQEIARQFQ